MPRFILFLVALICLPFLLTAQLPVDGITYRNLLECDPELYGSVEKITQIKMYQTGERKRVRYYFDEQNRLQSVNNLEGTEIEYFYDQLGNLSTQVVKQDEIVVDSLVGIYTNENHLRGLMTFRGTPRNLVSVQQVIYNRRNRPERIRVDEIRFDYESKSAHHYSAWQELKWKNENEFSVDQVSVNDATKYIVKNANTAALDTESGCLLQRSDNKRTINNVQGRTTVEIYKIKEDPEADKIMVEYEYDEMGNWVLQKHYSISDGARSRKKQRLMDIKRKIEYRDRKG